MPEHQDEIIRAQLLARYNALPEDKKKILRLFSVVYAPVNQTTMRKIVNALGWQTAGGMPLETMVDKSFREELIPARLIVFEQNAMYCHRAIVELLTREAVSKDEFEAMAQAAEQIVPTAAAKTSPAFYHLAPEHYGTAFRALRVAVYSGAMDKVSELLTRMPRHLRSQTGTSNPLVEIYANPLDGRWLEGLPDKLRLQVLRTVLVDNTLALPPCAEAFALLERLLPDQENTEWRLCLAEQRLLRGQLAGIEALLPGGGEAKELALSGWHRFIQGDTEGSITLYGEALKADKKATRKRNLYLSGLPGVFYVLALMRSGDPDHLSLARQQTAMAMKLQWEDDPYLDVFSLLDACIDVLQGKSRVTDQYRLAEDFRLFEPHVTLFHALALTWAGGKPKKAHTDRLVDCGRMAQNAGIAWYAAACAGLLERLGRPFDWKAAERTHKAEGYYGLVDLIPRQEAWQRALDALKTLKTGSSASNAAAEESAQALRMVWMLQGSGSYVTLHPREQKRSKNGRWTKGRPIALKRLHEEPEAFDYMTAEDRRICRHIERYTEYAYFNRYPRETFELDNDQALLAAIGHSRVFREEDPATPVELVKGEPRLLVERKKGRLHLRLEPPARADETVVIEPEGSHRLRVIELTEDQCQVAKILGSGGLTVPAGARRQLTDSIAGLTGFITVQSDVGGGSAAEKVAADATPHLHLQPSGGGVTLELFVQPFGQKGPLFRPGEGGATVMAEIDGKRLQAQRDLEQEAQATARVLDGCPALAGYAEESWHLSDPETALETLLWLETLGDAVVLEWPQGKPIRLSREIDSKQLHVSVHKQEEWFALEGTIALDDDNVLEMSRLLELIKQSSGRFVQLGEGQFLTLTRELRRRLDELRTFGSVRKKGLYFHPVATAAVEAVTQGMEIRPGKEWKQQLQRLTEAQTLNPLPPSTLQGELRDYQLDGFRWLARLAHWGAGACLADDMGLGKTVQALALILTRAMHGPTLILAPTSVCMNWLDEAARFAPTLNARLFGAGDRTRMLDEAGPFDLIVCSYGLLQNESERLAKKEWTTIVADEAQAIKNAHTKRSKAVMTLQAEFKVITTGTPIENHLGELWNLFRFINPGLLGSLERFNRHFARPIELHGDRDARQHLKKLIQPFILRRLKSDVMSELPPRTEITMHVELGTEEIALVEALRRQALEQLARTEDEPAQKRIKILGEIMRLRRACCNPKLVLPDSAVSSSKLQAFGELVEELLANRHKALVFSQFVDHLTLIRAWLDQRAINYQYLDGSTPAKKRKTAVDAFQAGEGDLFLISLKAGGTGLNLTAADYVIHMDPWWNPAVEDQASDRAHRIGQQRPVTIYRLVAKNTIEEKIVKLHARKRDLADSLLEGTGTGAAMSVDEMMALIRDAQ